MKNVCVVLDGFFSLRNGQLISPNMGYDFWKRYLSVFNTVTVLTRYPRSSFKDGKIVCGKNLFLCFVPFFDSFQSLYNTFGIAGRSFFRLRKTHSFILRAPGLLPLFFGLLCCITKKKYSVEVVAEPADVFSKNSFEHPLRPIIRFFFVGGLRFLCRNAFAVSYVTESFLQKRYPPSSLSFCTHFSSIDLLPSFFSPKKRVSIKREYPVLINCAMMQKKIKGQDIFLKTIYLLKQKGFFAQGILVGGGDHSTYFKNLANSLGIQRQIRFVGLLPSGSRISRIMDQADFYISPSRQEGLPRSVIEAMARSLPCLASNVGGTSELLPQTFLLDHNPASYAQRIIQLWMRKKQLSLIGVRNRRFAKRYLFSRLSKRRTFFYRYIFSKDV